MSIQSSVMPIWKNVSLTSFHDLLNFIMFKSAKCPYESRKRSAPEDCIPLEEIEEWSEDINNKEIKIREASCNPVKELLETLDTVSNKAREIPEKLLGGYSKQEIPEVEVKKPLGRKIAVHKKLEELKLSAVQELDLREETQVNIEKEADIQPEYTTCETFKIGPLIGFPRITPKDMVDAARFNHDLDYKATPVIFEHQQPELCVACGDKSFTHLPSLSQSMKDMHEGRAMVRGSTRVANFAGFMMWIDSIVEDFITNPQAKDSLHKANDLFTIAPYLGIALNVLVDIDDKNYLGVLENLGIFLVLEIFPEFALPLLLIQVIVDAIEQHKNMKKLVEQTMRNILLERDQLLDSMLISEGETLAEKFMGRMKKAASIYKQQLIFTAKATIHNIKHYSHKFVKTGEEKILLNEKITKVTQKLWHFAENQYYSAIEEMCKVMKKTLTHDFKEIANGRINDFNEQTKSILKQMLNNDKNIDEHILDDALNIIENHIKQYNIKQEIEKELKIVEAFFKNEFNTFKKIHIPILHMKVDNEHMVDAINNAKIEIEGAHIVAGRNGSTLKLKQKDQVTLITANYNISL